MYDFTVNSLNLFIIVASKYVVDIIMLIIKLKIKTLMKSLRKIKTINIDIANTQYDNDKERTSYETNRRILIYDIKY